MILDEIVARTWVDLKSAGLEDWDRSEALKEALLTRKPFSFLSAIRQDGISLIAELKKHSPSAGLIREDFDPVAIGEIYRDNGARVISCLTEKTYFKGAPEFLSKASAAVDLPFLRKDFIVHERQIIEARTLGASAVLLIVAILEKKKINEFLQLAKELELGVLLEIHNKEEMEVALDTDAEVIGINNRNLKTMEVSLETTFELREMVGKDRCLVSESGIKTNVQVSELEKAGIDAILVGEHLMRQPDIGSAVRQLMENTD